MVLFGSPDWTDYTLQADMRVIRARRPDNPLRAWFGPVLRAQDPHNYEMFWLMPQHSGKVGAVAYVPVAHGVVPWWTEAYSSQKHGKATVPFDEWVHVRAEVRGREAALWVNGEEALRKTLTYYLHRGRAGLYVGTTTDALFRNIIVDAL